MKNKDKSMLTARVEFNRPISRKDMLKLCYWSLCSAITKNPVHINFYGAKTEVKRL